MGKNKKAPEKSPKNSNSNDELAAPRFLERSEEKEIIGRVQKGDVNAFTILVDAYKQKAYYTAYGFVNNHEDALDLSQDAFIKAFKAIKTFDLKAPFFPWFYKIIKNHCLNHIKKNKRFEHQSIEEQAEDQFIQYPDTKPLPDDLYQMSDMNLRLWKAIETLKPDFREIITLKHYHGLSYKEIAEALNIPIGTVMSRLFNARQELKDIVEKDEIPPNQEQ